MRASQASAKACNQKVMEPGIGKKLVLPKRLNK